MNETGSAKGHRPTSATIRQVIVTTAPLSVVAVVTLAVELCTISLGNMCFELTIGMLVVGPMDHLPTSDAGMSGVLWGLHAMQAP